MEEQDTCARGGDLNGTEQPDETPHQKEDTGAGQDLNHCEEQPEGGKEAPKVESEDEGFPESCDSSGDDKPEVKVQGGDESIEVQEPECVAEGSEAEQGGDTEGEAVKESGKEEPVDEPVNEVSEQQQQQQEEEEPEANHQENHINGTSTKEENNHIEAEEELTKEAEENCKNKEQDAGDTVDFQKTDIRNHHEDSHQTISELKSKWDSFGKEQSSPPIEHIHCHSGMADTKSRFGGAAEKCNQCNKTVYAMERLEVAGRLMHKTCFRCCKCNSPLNVGRFSVGGGELYCLTHYKQAFREKGTYDVFTPDNPIKGKWQSKPAE